MLGWMILFGLLALCGGLGAMTGHPAANSAKTASIVFAALLIVAVFTRIIRDRAR
jgi:uncharacterized membrane protein YtjA (UPF0391 family)